MFTLMPPVSPPTAQDPQTQVADIVTDIFTLAPTPGMRVVTTTTTTTTGTEVVVVAAAGGSVSGQHHAQNGDGLSAAPVMAESSAAAVAASSAAAAAAAAAHSFASTGSVDRNEFDASLSPKPDVVVDEGPVDLEAFATTAAVTAATDAAAATTSTTGTDEDTAGLHGRGWLSTEDAMGAELGPAPAVVQAAAAVDSEGQEGAAPSNSAPVEAEAAPPAQEAEAAYWGSVGTSAGPPAQAGAAAEGGTGWGLLARPPPLFSHELTDTSGSLMTDSDDGCSGDGGGD